MAVGMFIFPSKCKDKEYPYCKDTKAVLNITDDNVFDSKYIKGVYHVIHYNNEYDNLNDKDLVDMLNKIGNFSLKIGQRKSGLGYTTEDKEHYIRLIRQTKEWFYNKIKF